MSEKMTKCKACDQQIAKSAKNCPHCGAKNKKGAPVLVGIIVAIVLIAIIASAGSGEPKKVGDVADSTTSSTEAKVPATTDKTTFAVGEIAELKGVKVALLGVTESTGSQFNTPADGKIFVLCEFEISNESQEDVAISSMLSFKGYCDDYVCEYSLGALMEKGDKNQLDGTVTPGKKMNGVIGYELPVDWKKLEVQFTPDFWSGKEIVFIATNP